MSAAFCSRNQGENTAIQKTLQLLRGEEALNEQEDTRQLEKMVVSQQKVIEKLCCWRLNIAALPGG